MWSLLSIEVAKYFDTPFGFRVTNCFPYIYYLRHVAPFFSQIKVQLITCMGAVAIIRQSDSPTVRQFDKCFISLKVNTITCVIWGQKSNRLLTIERSRTSETRYHRRTNNWQGYTRTKKTHIYEQHGLHKNLDPVVMNRWCQVSRIFFSSDYFRLYSCSVQSSPAKKSHY